MKIDNLPQYMRVLVSALICFEDQKKHLIGFEMFPNLLDQLIILSGTLGKIALKTVFMIVLSRNANMLSGRGSAVFIAQWGKNRKVGWDSTKGTVQVGIKQVCDAVVTSSDPAFS